MHHHSRPSTPTVHAPRMAVPGQCPECAAHALAQYRVISEGGWWTVVKCQQCLASLTRKPAPMFGAFVPLGSPR